MYLIAPVAKRREQFMLKFGQIWMKWSRHDRKKNNPDDQKPIRTHMDVQKNSEFQMSPEHGQLLARLVVAFAADAQLANVTLASNTIQSHPHSLAPAAHACPRTRASSRRRRDATPHLLVASSGEPRVHACESQNVASE